MARKLYNHKLHGYSAINSVTAPVQEIDGINIAEILETLLGNYETLSAQIKHIDFSLNDTFPGLPYVALTSLFATAYRRWTTLSPSYIDASQVFVCREMN